MKRQKNWGGISEYSTTYLHICLLLFHNSIGIENDNLSSYANKWWGILKSSRNRPFYSCLVFE